MSNVVTLINLRASIRNRGEWRSSYISDSELNGYINESIAALEDLVSTNDPSYFLKTASADMLTGQWYASLPPDFLKMVGVSAVVAAEINVDGYQTLEQFNWEERHDHNFTAGPEFARWHIRGNNIHWNPKPIADTAIFLEYIPSHTALTADDDTYSFQNYWQEWVILDVAIKCCAKEETDPSVYAAQLGKTESRIVKYSKRTITAPQTVTGSSLSLSQLQLLARNRGGWSREDITDPQLTAWINSSISALRDLICIHDHTYFLSFEDVVFDPDAPSADLPSDFFKLVGASIPDPDSGPDAYAYMEQFNWEERWDAYNVADWVPRYHVRGNEMFVHPPARPGGALTVRVEYIPVFQNLSAPTDSTLLYNNWQEWVLLEVAIKACASTNTDPKLYLAQQTKVEKRIIEFDLRDLAQPVTVTNESNLQTLRLAVRARGGWDKRQLNDSQLTNWINSSISDLRDLICTHDPSYFVSHQDVTFGIGSQIVDLPTNFFKVVGVLTPDPDVGADAYGQVEQFNWEERWDGYDSVDWRFRYHIRGNSMYVHPVPWAGPVKMRIEYIPTFAGLSNPTDTTPLYNNWQEHVLLNVAIKACGLTGTDPTVYAAQLQKIEKRIVEFDLRDLSDPATPTNQSDLQSLRLAVRARGPWDKKVLNDSQLTNWINSSISGLRDMISAIDNSYFLTESFIAVGNDFRQYDLPSDFFKMVGVDVVDDPDAGADGYSALEHFNWEERSEPATLADATELRFNIRGNILHLHPTPTGAEIIRIQYIPTFAGLSKPADSTLLFNNWQEWVVLDVAIKACALTATDPKLYLAQQQITEKRIKDFDLIDLTSPTTPSTDGTNLRDLQYSVRARGAWTKEQINDSQLTAWLNSSISALRDTISEIDHSYFVEYSDAAITAGNREYALPSNFFKMVGVDAYDSGITDGYQALNHFNWSERFDVAESAKLSTRYNIRGSFIHLQPTPTWSGKLRLEFIPTYTNLVNPTDTIDLYNNWQEWVILDCAVKCASLTGTDPQVFMAQLQAVDSRIKKFAMRNLVDQTTPSSDSSNLRDMQLAIRSRGSWSKEDVNDAQLTSFLNSSISGFVDLAAMADPSLYLSRSDISVVSGQKEYDLPSDFYKMQGVASRDSSNPDGYVVLERFDFDERYDFSYTSQTWNTRYMVYGNMFHLQPAPNWSGVIRLEYVPLPTALSDPTDSFNFYNGWEEWVILDVCEKVAMLLDKNPQFWVSQKAAIEKRINRSAERDIGKPKTVVDVYRPSKQSRWWH